MNSKLAMLLLDEFAMNFLSSFYQFNALLLFAYKTTIISGKISKNVLSEVDLNSEIVLKQVEDFFSFIISDFTYYILSYSYTIKDLG